MTFFNRMTKSKRFKKIMVAAFFVLSGGVWLGYWIYGHYYVSTDDAYLNANVIQIAPRVSGKVIKVYINNNQYVKKDQPLFDIDPEPFQLAVNSAQAQLNLSNAELDNATLTKNRVLTLAEKKFVSTQEGDNAVSEYKTAQAKVEESKARLDQANLDLRYTRVISPATGWVTNVSLNGGDIVHANQALFALISDDKFWVDANFKETQLEAIKPGQTATIVTDLYPGHPFNGVVESISGGTGSAFSLLPPQNATGNWVKVTQRIPVRVLILNPDVNLPLRIGSSATVTVHLRQYLYQKP
ncbi:Multidrug export protein EmrA [Aquicella siphonis]|uniref:Multidrug export protein EmrA n=1 Tax=Aquicella siphonis TaxID=254247 RepID=A0A5E4PK64_9COXI|nr:HlyD family secretion protein [Aquicella siphonis]VVC76955.1 Multidrug export protein EmrA [Aquicella siphonis]